jgi:hypothetical protein
VHVEGGTPSWGSVGDTRGGVVELSKRLVRRYPRHSLGHDLPIRIKKN